MSGSECETSCKVSDPQHSQKLLRVLRTFWLEQSFHDALLVVGEEELAVQKNILAAASPYIRSAQLGGSLSWTPPLRLLFSCRVLVSHQDQAELQPPQAGRLCLQDRAAGRLHEHHEADPGLHLQR